ncbi:MAG: carboxypeptidase-like regulatory domain-containing protein, partial [Bacteroidales bacterium]
MRILVIILLVINSLQFSIAQVEVLKSSISGKVIDIETQQPLPYVNIILEGTTTGTISDEDGNFSIDNVSIGRYTLLATMIGYEQAVFSDITVVPKRTTR